MSSNNSVSTQTTAASSCAQSAPVVLPKKVVMDVPADSTAPHLKAMIEKFYGKVNHVDIRHVYPDRTLAFVGFRRHQDAALAGFT